MKSEKSDKIKVEWGKEYEKTGRNAKKPCFVYNNVDYLGGFGGIFMVEFFTKHHRRTFFYWGKNIRWDENRRADFTQF